MDLEVHTEPGGMGLRDRRKQTKSQGCLFYLFYY